MILMKQSESFNHNVNDIGSLLVILPDLQGMRSEDSLFLPLKLWIVDAIQLCMSLLVNEIWHTHKGSFDSPRGKDGVCECVSVCVSVCVCVAQLPRSKCAFSLSLSLSLALLAPLSAPFTPSLYPFPLHTF